MEMLSPCDGVGNARHSPLRLGFNPLSALRVPHSALKMFFISPGCANANGVAAQSPTLSRCNRGYVGFGSNQTNNLNQVAARFKTLLVYPAHERPSACNMISKVMLGRRSAPGYDPRRAVEATRVPRVGFY
jgi:hypothetical protein